MHSVSASTSCYCLNKNKRWSINHDFYVIHIYIICSLSLSLDIYIYIYIYIYLFIYLFVYSLIFNEPTKSCKLAHLISPAPRSLSSGFTLESQLARAVSTNGGTHYVDPRKRCTDHVDLVAPFVFNKLWIKKRRGVSHNIYVWMCGAFPCWEQALN